MAIEKVINVVINTDKAEKPTKDLINSFDGLSDSVEKSNDSAQKSIENTGKASKKANKSVGVLSGGFKKLGTVIKAAGIGLVISLVAGLTAALSRNQKIIDASNTVFEAISIVLSKISTALVDVYESVAKSSENFDGLTKVLLGMINIAITPLKLGFLAIKLAIKESQLAWEKSFLGGNDNAKIKQLTSDIELTKESISNAGAEAIQSGKDVVTNFSDMVSEVSDIASKVGTEIGKISVKSALEQAKTNVQIKNSALLAAAQQQFLVEKYDILAEKQRQIRDEERNTIEDRIKANDQLGVELNKQEQAMLKTADLQIASAKAELDKNKTIENQILLTEALTNKEGVLAQVEGFRSEQLVNDLALKKEQIELDNTISDREKQRQLDRLDFEAEIRLTEEGKNEKLQERLDLENEIILEDLEKKRELFKEGTQARVDAEQDFLDAEEIIAQKQIALANKVAEDKIKADKKEKEAKAAILDAQLDNVAGGFSLLSSLAEKNKGLQIASIIADSAVGIAKTVISTQAANSAVRLKYAPLPGGELLAAAATSANNIASGISIATITAAASKGIGSLGGGGGGGSSSSSGGGGNQSAPSFNLIEGTQGNQIANAITTDQPPVKAYVVGSEMSTQQQLDRNKVEVSSL
tara:strand:+ start:37 stop:1959 length:1923 start_codon:yes stop_codon:yes gene_type:complete